MRKIEELITRPGFLECVGSGDRATIYKIRNTSYAVKTIHTGVGTAEKMAMLERENEINQALYCSKVSVPKPEGIFEITHPSTRQSVPGFVREYIDGVVLFKIIDKKLREKFKRLRDEEIAFAERIGFIPGDCYHEGNVLWSFEKEKVYLIDFEFWTKLKNDLMGR